MSTAEKSERPEQNQDLKCESGPSAQISDLHLDKFTTPATFACWKMRFKTEVCTCSQIPT